MLTRTTFAAPGRMERHPRQRIIPSHTSWTSCQVVLRHHIAVLEQATVALFEGYLSSSLYGRAAHAAEQLLVLTKTLAWHEGTRVAQAMASFFHTGTAFDLVHALHLSELLAAFHLEMTLATAANATTVSPMQRWREHDPEHFKRAYRQAV